MPSGVKIKDIATGTGLPAEKSSQVIVHVRGTLRRGDVLLDTNQNHRPLRIELGKRECIAGLRYGIIGMRVGGRRELVVSPHLGYGEIPALEIPANAVLRFEVELLEVRPTGISKPEDFPPGRHLYFFWPGEMKCNRPRIQFGLEEDGRCGVILTPSPQPGLTWRHVRFRAVDHHLESAEVAALFDEVEKLPHEKPEACVDNEALWADASEKANSVTRDSGTNIPCVTIGISERGGWSCYYSVRENDPVLLRSKLFKLVKRLVEQTSGLK